MYLRTTTATLKKKKTHDDIALFFCFATLPDWRLGLFVSYTWCLLGCPLLKWTEPGMYSWNTKGSTEWCKRGSANYCLTLILYYWNPACVPPRDDILTRPLNDITEYNEKMFCDTAGLQVLWWQYYHLLLFKSLSPPRTVLSCCFLMRLIVSEGEKMEISSIESILHWFL